MNDRDRSDAGGVTEDSSFRLIERMLGFVRLYSNAARVFVDVMFEQTPFGTLSGRRLPWHPRVATADFQAMCLNYAEPFKVGQSRSIVWLQPAGEIYGVLVVTYTDAVVGGLAATLRARHEGVH